MKTSIYIDKCYCTVLCVLDGTMDILTTTVVWKATTNRVYFVMG